MTYVYGKVRTSISSSFCRPPEDERTSNVRSLLLFVVYVIRVFIYSPYMCRQFLSVRLNSPTSHWSRHLTTK